jgi:hypothetical protein
MFEYRSTGRGGRHARWLLILSFVLLMALTTVTVSAQGETSEPDPLQPSNETGIPDETLRLEPIILSETRSGDATNITIEIPVGADTFTASNRPTTNFSTDSFLRVGFNTAVNGAQRSFVFFPMTNIPRNAVVQNATLRMFVAGFAPNNDAPMGILARFLTTAWDPNILTWNNFNPQWGAEIGVGQIPASTGWREADITGPVREWVWQLRPNNGFMLQGDESPGVGRERIFFAINANNGLHPRVVVTYQIDNTAPTVTMTPLGQWAPGTFQVRWAGQDNSGGAGIRFYDVQSRLNGGAWQNWQSQTTATSANFTGVNAGFYEFRVRATDWAGNVSAWPNTPQASTRVDTVAPNSIVNPLPQFTFSDSFTVTWSGLDPQPGSGIARYNVEVQMNGGAWQPFVTDSTATSAVFNGAVVGATYGFRVRALDFVVNVEPWSPQAEAQTTISGGDPVAEIVPFSSQITQQPRFMVQWRGIPVPGTRIDSFDVQFRFNNGAWTSWLSSFPDTSSEFIANQGDGVYEFRVRARDNAGKVSPWAEGPGNAIAVDTVAPFIVPQVWLPVVPNTN